jgi:hypothetical protein
MPHSPSHVTDKARDAALCRALGACAPSCVSQSSTHSPVPRALQWAKLLPSLPLVAYLLHALPITVVQFMKLGHVYRRLSSGMRRTVEWQQLTKFKRCLLPPLSGTLLITLMMKALSCLKLRSSSTRLRGAASQNIIIPVGVRTRYLKLT